MDVNEKKLDNLNPKSQVYKAIVDEIRLNSLKKCLICNKEDIEEDFRPLCRTCYLQFIEKFPEKYCSKDMAFEKFCKKFDEAYDKYDEIKGYIIIKMELPFSSPFTVVDVEATGDIFKNKNNFIITMGYFRDSIAEIYQLIDFTKKNKFHNICKKAVYRLKPPLVAYNANAERNWLKVYHREWIDLIKYTIKSKADGTPVAQPIGLNKISFKWDDIDGGDCVEESAKYVQDKNLNHLKKIAYHNLIDLVKEYQLGLKCLKIYDYLNGKMWDYEKNQLRERYTCPKCFKSFFSESELDLHVKTIHAKKKKKN
ncbi:MAG: ribonuclease H-like domain-containing protein [Promethearchaeota archaeon]